MADFPLHNFIFYPGQREAFRIRDAVTVSEWAEANFRLTTAYAMQGKLKLFPWQFEPLNAILHYDQVLFIAPVQTGKSLMAEIVCGYLVDNDNMNMMLCYAKKETVEDVFDERLKPMIMEVPCLRRYWGGAENNLTKKRIKLRHLIIRVSSAGVRSDIASHNAGFIYGSELAKWPSKDFDPVKMLFGRQQASRMMNKKVRGLFETSPLDETDKSYTLSHRDGTLFLQPHFPCPHCGHYIVFTDTQIKEVPSKAGVFDHDPLRIRLEGAAKYFCEVCQKEITEKDRLRIFDKVVWAEIDKKTHKTIENIDKNGKVINRRRAKTVVYNWNRLLDVTWSFAECLACYFEALRSPNPEDLRTYQNEDMARWVKITSKRIGDQFLLSKRQKYHQFGSDAYIPDEVKVLVLGIDTQDSGFYYVVRGFGKGMESWLVRADFVHCDMKDSKNGNPAEVNDKLISELFRYPYAKRDGKKMPIVFGLIDRGGHRAGDVDYIVNHSSFVNIYIGGTRKDQQLIEQKKSGYYYGNTQNLSRIVQKQIESEVWHLPIDIQKAYMDQVLNQYDEEFTDTRGNKKKRWVTVDPDHYRDCENMIAGATIAMDMQSMLFDDKEIEDIDDKMGTINNDTPIHAVNDQEYITGQSASDYLKGGGWG